MDDDLKLVEDRTAAVERVRQRIVEIDKHVAQYPSWVGGSTEQHAQDCLLLIDTIARHHSSRTAYQDTIDQMNNTIDGLEFLNAKLVKERDEARGGMDRLETAYGALSDDVFFAHPKIAAMAKALPEAEAQRDAALEALTGLEPFLDAIVCYASSMDEHEPNRLAVNARAVIASSRAIGGGE